MIMYGILRGLNAPLSYYLSTYLKPSLGDGAYILATGLATAIIEIVIEMDEALAIGEWIKNRTSLFSFRKRKKMVICDASKTEQITRYLVENHPDLVTCVRETETGQFHVSEIRPGSQITILGHPIKIRVSNKDNGSVESYTVEYPATGITSSEILHHFISYISRQTILRTYRAKMNTERRNTPSFESWQVGYDMCLDNVENTFYTETVQEELVEDVMQYISDFLSGKNNVPQKKTYFLYGDPGSGKTSISRSVLGRYKIFNFPGELFRDASECEAAARAIRREISLGEVHVVVIDEIDKCSCFSSKWSIKGSLGPLCSFLDGVWPDTGRITIITGNNRKLFDKNPVLERPGRVDRSICMRLPDDRQLRRTLQYHRPDWVLPEEKMQTGMAISAIIQNIRRGMGLEEILQAIEEEKPPASSEEVEKLEGEKNEKTAKPEYMEDIPDNKIILALPTAIRRLEEDYIRFIHTMIADAINPDGAQLGKAVVLDCSFCNPDLARCNLPTVCLYCSARYLHKCLYCIQNWPEEYEKSVALLRSYVGENGAQN